MNTVFSIDGVGYPTILVESLKRKFSVLDGENAGRVKTGEMQRDIIGTYYNYSLELDTSEASLAEYDRLYEVLSSPQDKHSITVPYGQTSITFDAYISNGEDELFSMESSRNLWGELSINFIAIAPKRRPA